MFTILYYYICTLFYLLILVKENEFPYSKIKSKPPFNILLRNGCLHLFTHSFHSYYTHTLSTYVTDCVIVTEEYK